MDVFFDMEYTQEFEKHGRSFENIARYTCSKQMFSKCEAVEDLNVDGKPCGKRTNVFWVQFAVGKFIDYFR